MFVAISSNMAVSNGQLSSGNAVCIASLKGPGFL